MRSSASAASSSSASTRSLDLLRRAAGRAHARRHAPRAARFCCGIVDAVAPYAVAVKPQSAFFEALGADGVRAFEEVCDYARAAGLLVIADAKRGDIGSTARAYAAAFVEPRGDGPPLADAVTVNPYLGRDSLEPFLAACRRDGAGIFCLVKTSNAGGADVQDVVLSDGRPLWQHVAGLVREWGEETRRRARPLERSAPSSARRSRARSPRRGGCCRRRSCCSCPASARRARPRPTSPARSRAGPASALVSASRSVIYAGGGDWRAAAGAEATRLAREVWAVSGW